MTKIKNIICFLVALISFFVLKEIAANSSERFETALSSRHNNDNTSFIDLKRNTPFESINADVANTFKESAFQVALNKNYTLAGFFPNYILGNENAEKTLPKEPKEGKEKVSPYNILAEHLGDSYSWHMFGDYFGKATIYLPVIVGKRWSGWEVFSSKNIENGATYNGYFISKQGKYEGKIVYLGTDNKELRPLDLSITKDVFALMLSSAILLIILFSLKNYYKRNPLKMPKGFKGMLESLSLMLINEVIKPCLREKYREYSPYLLTLFYFILTINLLGLIVVFPGGVNLSGNISICLVLAGCTLVITLFSATRHYWKEIFLPDVPLWLNAPIPIMTFLEVFGIFSKPFALMIRMFANLFGGHVIILILTTLIFVFAPFGLFYAGMSSVFVVIFSAFMLIIEVLICFIQAYVFMMLSSLFIGLTRV
ncbi:MAG: F0F1 ATP synthase subunit A [Bacteroidales bacterium]|nr:F0F1 ATP synthase subunit A [Bacteroidales bacterium]